MTRTLRHAKPFRTALRLQLSWVEGVPSFTFRLAAEHDNLSECGQIVSADDLLNAFDFDLQQRGR